MVTIDNQTTLIVLQHPSEVKNHKATVPMLSGSLNNVHVFVGEDFSSRDDVKSLLDKFSWPVLLYPSDSNCVVFDDVNDTKVIIEANKKPDCLIVLDGTWRKAYKIYQLTHFLHEITHFALSEQFPCRYSIRKTDKKGALSTLEASCFMLSIVEQNAKRYQPLLDKFLAFNDYQQKFVKSQPHKNNG